MAVPFMNLKKQYEPIMDEVHEAVHQVLDEAQFRGGPRVAAFEKAVAEYCNAPHAIGVSTGTDAMLLPMMSLNLQPGDEVITTPWTFFATAGAIANAGGVPIFVDIEPDTFNIDATKIEAAITEKTRAIIAVHIFGQCADMDAILEIGKKHNLPVFEDSAQAIGAEYKGRRACSMGAAGGISFYPSKNLGTAGEGGMVVVNSEEMRKKIHLLHYHGMGDVQYVHEIVGTNSHLHTIQAAILHIKLRLLDEWNARRRFIAEQYNAAFAELDGIVIPKTLEGNHHVWHQYVIRAPRRDEGIKLLKDRGIDCAVFYPKSLNKQKCFQNMKSAQCACPESERAVNEVIALPIYPEMTDEQIQEVIDGVKAHAAAGVAAK